MKFKSILFVGIFIQAMLWSAALTGQTVDDVLKILTEKGVLKASDVDSLRAEAALARQNVLPQNQLIISMEYRPRAEMRHGYQQLPADTSVAAFFTGQRTRLSLGYEYSNKLSIAFSMQDLRIWGNRDPKGTEGTVQVFEAWAEPSITPEWSVRVGRQRLSYDNQRLFSENNWRMGGAVHDAAVLKYEGSKLTVHLAGAFNQTSEQLTGTDYRPTTFSNYKSLLMNYIQYRPSDKITLTVINAADGWQDNLNPEKIHQRLTSGGRVDFKSGTLGAGVGGWYQYGHNPKGKEIAAWYLNPELRYSADPIHLRAGAELFSGNKPEATATDRSFTPLYGSGHAFNGAMDMFTRFPADVGGAGLINPYLILQWNISKTFSIRSDFHGFSLQNRYIKSEDPDARWLGVETDCIVNYKPNNYTSLELGMCAASVTETFELIKSSQPGSHNTTPYFVYFALTIKPTLLKMKW